MLKTGEEKEKVIIPKSILKVLESSIDNIII